MGMAIAILIDATVVRMLLVPAIVKLMGNANWWTTFRRKVVAAQSAVLQETREESMDAV